MNHDHDVGASRKGLAVAGLLIASIAIICVMDKGVHPKALREGCGLVCAGVVDKNFDIDNVRQLSHGALQWFLSAVCRHYNRDTFAVDHGLASWLDTFLPLEVWNLTHRKAMLSGAETK